MVFSSRADRHRQQIRNLLCRHASSSTSEHDADARLICAKIRFALLAGHHACRYSAASDVAPPALELCRSTLRPRERISLTSTLNDSGMPASKVSSPRTIASYTLVRPATSSDFTVSISCKVYAAP